MYKKYFTTPIFYVNDKPHIGHSYNCILADFLNRYYRQKGIDSFLMTGTDEHGQKILHAASKKQTPVEEYVVNLRQSFIELMEAMKINYDFFIYTSADFHKKAVQKFWQKLEEKGLIYSGSYSGWYSMAEETFYKDKDLKDGKTPFGHSVEWVVEESSFFKLSAFQEKLLEFYESNPEFIMPVNRRNEVIQFVKNGLEDLSVSRKNISHGIPVPSKENETIYVWFDALINYISGLGFANEQWMSDRWSNAVHIVGKDIIIFHCVIWPAMLMALDLPTPKQIVVHGWWTVDNQKMSKSLGNVLSHKELLEQHNLDNIRFFLFKGISLGNDGDFSEEVMKNTINTELANNIGNMVTRTMAMLDEYNGGFVPFGNLSTETDMSDIDKKMDYLVENYKFSQYVDEILYLSQVCNKLIDKYQPWKHLKNHSSTMDDLFFSVCTYIYKIAYYLNPICPDLAEQIFNCLSLKYRWTTTSSIEGLKTTKPQAIVKKYINKIR